MSAAASAVHRPTRITQRRRSDCRPLTATRSRGDARCAGTQLGSGEALRQVGPAVLYPSSPGLLVLRALQVGSEVDCFLFFGLTHPEKAGLISPQSGKKPSLTLNQPTWLARQAP